jgi:hypothetical protein
MADVARATASGNAESAVSSKSANGERPPEDAAKGRMRFYKLAIGARFTIRGQVHETGWARRMKWLGYISGCFRCVSILGMRGIRCFIS